MRTFAVYPEPHVADPAWVAPVAEIHKDDTATMFCDAHELLKVALDLHQKIGKQSGIAQENIRTMKFFESKGWTREQIKEWQFFRGNEQ